MMPTAYEAGKETTAKILGNNNKTRRDNKSGIAGVSWIKRRKKWGAYCKTDGKQRWLGSYDDLESAAKAVQKYHTCHERKTQDNYEPVAWRTLRSSKS